MNSWKQTSLTGEDATFTKDGEVPAGQLNIDEQLAMYDAHVDAAWEDLIDNLFAIKVAVKRRARERLTTVGARDYGDMTWHKSLDEIASDALDEAADLLVYGTIALAIEKGSVVQAVEDSRRLQAGGSDGQQPQDGLALG